jgi:hypothetical protein
MIGRRADVVDLRRRAPHGGLRDVSGTGRVVAASDHFASGKYAVFSCATAQARRAT